MQKSLLNLLILYLTIGVDVDPNAPGNDPPAVDPPEGDDSGEEDDPGEDPPEGEGEGESESEPPQRASRRNDDIRTARETAQRERDARIRAEAERDAIRQSQQRPASDPTFEQEEAILRDPNSDETAKWRVQVNRTLRAEREQSQRILFEANNARDQMSFRDYANERNPGYFKAYQKRVEDKFAESLRAGQPQSRVVLFKLMLADDLLEGRIKSAKSAGSSEGKKSGVPRGKTPGARSDVSRGSQSEQDKRRARLENQQL